MKLLPWCALLCLVSCVASASREPTPSSAESGAVQGFFVASPVATTLAEDSAESPPAEPMRPPAAPADGRQVIYSASLRLVVVSAREAHASILSIARAVGGHLQESDTSSITIRVPAGAFEGVLARLGTLGEVVESHVRASDVTEEMLDLGIRLENARKARERLLEHLAKSEDIEATLKIELELTRVTETIERLEGRLRYLESQIAMSTIRVDLNSNEPQRGGTGLGLPFDWIERLGDGLVAGTVKGLPRKPRFLARGPRFEPPEGFVRYYSTRDLVEAMSADGLRIKVQEQDNHDAGALGFWSELARRALVQLRSLAIQEERGLGDERTLLRGTREVGGQANGYLLVLARTKDHVYTFEAWGPLEVFEARLQALVESASSLRK